MRTLASLAIFVCIASISIHSSTFLTWFATAQVLSPPSTGAVDASLACHVLQHQLGRSIVALPGEDQYDDGTHAAWNAFNTEFLPSCIVLPKEAAHVQQAMLMIYQHDLDYAVQAGGHSAMKGWNKYVNFMGILILFTFMDGVSYDPERDTITLLPGARWGPAVDALEPSGVAPVGGRVSDVGTGLLLGGGLSFLSPKHGFGADGFVELDVVLVNGSVVTATVDNEYRDLFKALKGGAGRLGIVTRYEVTAVHTGRTGDKNWFGGLLQYPDVVTKDFLRATAGHLKNKDPNASLLAFVGIIPTTDGQSVTMLPMAALFYNGRDDGLTPEETERKFNATFSDFLSLPRLQGSFLAPLSYHDMAYILAEGPAQFGLGQYFGASAFGHADSLDRYIHAVQASQELTSHFKDIISSSVVAFTPVLDTQIETGRRRGGNVISPPLGGYHAVQFQISVNPEASSSRLGELNLARGRLFRTFPPTPGLPLYINECDKTQKVFDTYGDYDFLKKTYDKYDPGRFNMRHTNGPLGL